MTQSARLAYTTRGGVVDNIHYGSVVVADIDGNIKLSIGDEAKRAFIRSAGKPLQAIALVENGGAEKFGFTDAELAIITASHSGGELQVKTVRSVLAKIGASEDDLCSGSGIEDNCSGKHSGMLALAKLLGLPLAEYFSPQHPIQKTIIKTVSEMCGLPVGHINVATDGCGAPIFEMPLRNMAVGYAKLANPDGLPAKREQACRKIVSAMQEHPEMVGGLDFRNICDKKIVAKAGASGAYCAGLVGKNLGFAMKIDDGSATAIHPVFFQVMRNMEIISEEELQAYLDRHPPIVKNRRGDVVGGLEIWF